MPSDAVQTSFVRTTLSDAVYQALLEGILSGHWPSGTQLSVVGLAAHLGVSRTPVHEALRQLANDGLVEQFVNRKARVAKFSAADVNEIFTMRLILEGEAVERAASRIDAAVLAELRQSADNVAATRGVRQWITCWAEFDTRFHEAIAAAAGLKRLAQDIGRYRLLHRGLNLRITDVSVLRQAMREHRAILSALAAGDGVAARAAMESHIARWQQYFVITLQR